MNNWLKNINADELLSFAPILGQHHSGSEEDTEVAAGYLYRDPQNEVICYFQPGDDLKEAEEAHKLKPEKFYWQQTKREIYTLICTEAEKYKELRKSLRAAKAHSTKSIVVLISSGIGAVMGVAAGVIAGFCAIILNTIIKLGKETYCSINRERYGLS